jgi:FixJ family two-component response regulator
MNEPEPRIFVVDDDDSFCRGVKRLLGSIGLNVETFGSPQEFMRHSPPQGPACLVLDMRLPGMSGLELQQALVAAGFRLPVIFLTGHATVPMSVRALKTGAVDFLKKPVEDQVLLDAVQHALARHRQVKAQEAALSNLRRRAATLTARERDVFDLVVIGLANKQIAAALGTSEKTVKIHRGRVMQKMQAPSLAHLVRMADRLGPLTAKVSAGAGEALEPSSL